MEDFADRAMIVFLFCSTLMIAYHKIQDFLDAERRNWMAMDDQHSINRSGGASKSAIDRASLSV